MTPAQTARYFYEWGRVRDVLKGQGRPCGDMERHKLHEKALGKKKSSKDFTNADLDKVLGVFRAITEPGNLKAQLHAIDQPELRNLEAQKACLALLVDLGIGKDESDPIRADWLRQSYLDGIVARITRRAKLNFSQLGDKDANAILHTLRMRRLAQQQAAQKHATPEPAVAGEQRAAKAELRRRIDADANCPF